MIVYVVWCRAGCYPAVFSTMEKAEAYVRGSDHKHFDIAALEVQ